jgi:ABC-2 type transport system permease protein
MNTMLMLVRREFWEHRSLWIAPLVMVGVILVMSTWGSIMVNNVDHGLHIGSAHTIDEIPGIGARERSELEQAMAMSPERKDTLAAISVFAIASLISLVAVIVVFFYLLDCLYSERRDRSILFWKSLPMSDAQVVLSKLLVALLVVPVGVIALTAVTQIVVSGIYWIRFHDTVLGHIAPAWSTAAWARSLWASLVVSIGGALWYVPVAGYLLLISVWARRNAFLWAVLPWPALMLVEKMFLDTTRVAEFLGQRLGGFVQKLDIASETFEQQAGDVQMPVMHEVFDAVKYSGLFGSMELWAGVAAGAVLIYAAIRIRRHRDDS